MTVLERRDTESNLTRAFGVHARTLEHLDARGLADELLGDRGARVDRLRLFDRVQIDLRTLPTRFPFLLITPQYNVEQAARAARVGGRARIVRGAEVTALRQDADGVDADRRRRAPCAPTTSSAPTACTAPCARRSACRSPASRC